MKKAQLRFGNGFKVVLDNRRAQSATMTILEQAKAALLHGPKE